jgi:uncharacterized membrane protein
MKIKDKKFSLTGFKPHISKALTPKNKRWIIILALLICLIAAGIIAVFHDYDRYRTPIARITHVENSLDSEAGNTKEKHYKQTLTGTVMNGKDTGSEVSIENKYTYSGVFDDEYRKGDEVFLKINTGSKNSLTGTIIGLKRDKSFAVLLGAFAILILMVSGRRGILSLLSLSFNIALFCYALYLYGKGQDILLLTNILVLLFTFTSLFFISGPNKKTFVGILATLITLAISMILFKVVMLATGDIDYAFMQYITDPNDLAEIFMSQILLGGLGAIMDVAITEAATVSELIAKDSSISVKDLVRSGREVGYDVMGTMINVMLFTYISGSIPLIILKMNSDVRLHTIILWHMPMELYRFLIGSISILLTIPVSLLVSIVLFKKSWRFK